ncbi:DUF2892 domain-containing protein [Candidatus Woesearchaeota archaeon]|nr:DUF2892 domain-containing protein [Candidatus Woesearchaeota archaeon]
MKKNLGSNDRTMRFIAGIILLLIVFLSNNINLFKAIIAIFAIIAIVESFIGYCHWYNIVKVNSAVKSKK